jgi:hypothetical protein
MVLKKVKCKIGYALHRFNNFINTNKNQQIISFNQVMIS